MERTRTLRLMNQIESEEILMKITCNLWLEIKFFYSSDLPKCRDMEYCPESEGTPETTGGGGGLGSGT